MHFIQCNELGSLKSYVVQCELGICYCMHLVEPMSKLVYNVILLSMVILVPCSVN